MIDNIKVRNALTQFAEEAYWYGERTGEYGMYRLLDTELGKILAERILAVIEQEKTND